MAIRILGVVASPRGANSLTLKLAEAFAEGARDAGAEVELVDVCRLHVEYCTACDICHRTGACRHSDDFPALRRKIIAADGLMLASPDYFGSVTAQMKTMLDRMADIIHCQRMSGKYGCSLATAGGPHGDVVTTYMNAVMANMGAWITGGVSVSVSGGPEALASGEQAARRLGHELLAAIVAKKRYPDQEVRHNETAAYFRRLVNQRKALWIFEEDYWQHHAP